MKGYIAGNPNEKAIGAGGCQLVQPSAVLTTVVEVVSECYAIGIRVDGTQIKSVIRADNGAVVNNLSWMNYGLNAGEYIGLRYPISSITLNAATDSVWLYNQPV